MPEFFGQCCVGKFLNAPQCIFFTVLVFKPHRFCLHAATFLGYFQTTKFLSDIKHFHFNRFGPFFPVVGSQQPLFEFTGFVVWRCNNFNWIGKYRWLYRFFCQSGWIYRWHHLCEHRIGSRIIFRWKKSHVDIIILYHVDRCKSIFGWWKQQPVVFGNFGLLGPRSWHYIIIFTLFDHLEIVLVTGNTYAVRMCAENTVDTAAEIFVDRMFCILDISKHSSGDRINRSYHRQWNI